MEGKWFAVYTRPRWEKKLSELLTKKKIENYCPLNKVDRPWIDRKKIATEPLFASYVFAYLSPDELVNVKQTPGFQSFVYWLGEPAVIKTEEIEAIRQFLTQYPQVTLEKTQVNFNDNVRFINDPAIHRKGNVVEVRNSTVKVMLPSLGQVLVADMNKENVDNLIYSQSSLLTV